MPACPAVSFPCQTCCDCRTLAQADMAYSSGSSARLAPGSDDLPDGLCFARTTLRTWPSRWARGSEPPQSYPMGGDGLACFRRSLPKCR